MHQLMDVGRHSGRSTGRNQSVCTPDVPTDWSHPTLTALLPASGLLSVLSNEVHLKRLLIQNGFGKHFFSWTHATLLRDYHVTKFLG